MSNQEMRHDSAGQLPTPSQTPQEQRADAARTARRKLLKAGLIAAPLVLTLRARPVLGQVGHNVSGLSGASTANP